MIHELDFSKVIKKIKKTRDLTAGEKIIRNIFKQYEGAVAPKDKMNIENATNKLIKMCNLGNIDEGALKIIRKKMEKDFKQGIENGYSINVQLTVAKRIASILKGAL